MTVYRKKLIEVALPLDAINEGSKPETENTFLKRHPRAIHNWWARTPLSVCRAVLFSQMVDDPGEGLNSDEADQARAPLLDLVRRLGCWNATTDEQLIGQARAVLKRQFHGKLPAVWDMFAGRGSISIEAQRLGFDVYSSDLNPVAVTIQKALLQFPQEFDGLPPVNSHVQGEMSPRLPWQGKAAEGLIQDIIVYGERVRAQAAKRIGHLYPKVSLPGSDNASVSAWLWARTVRCPNPACGAQMPLVRSFALSNKKNKIAWVKPIVERSTNPPIIRFEVVSGSGRPQMGTVKGKSAQCICCKTSVSSSYLHSEGKAKRLGEQLMAVVVQRPRGKVYCSPDYAHMDAAMNASPDWQPETELPEQALGISSVQPYGMSKHADLFSRRQLSALSTLVGIIDETKFYVVNDAKLSNMNHQLAENYGNAIVTYLTCALSRMTDYHCALSTWNPTNENVRNLFQMQVIPMVWDFAEANPIEGNLDFSVAARWVAESLQTAPSGRTPATVFQHDARSDIAPPPLIHEQVIVSTDPPYYDNIDYANLSDFFYVWLRKTLRTIDPETFRTVLTPKTSELIASPFRHGGSEEAAKTHFREGFSATFKSIRRVADPSVPTTVYYAYKQSETRSDKDGHGATASTGWETMLDGLVNAGFVITGTWPVRTTKKARSVARNANALASAIIIVCRERDPEAEIVSRREFINVLKWELPPAVKTLQHENIAPVDLAQAAIGPGMGIFSKHSQVLEADGSPMSVRSALIEINRVLDETLAAQEGDMDPDTRFCVAWFEQHGTSERSYGEAEVLFIAKNTSFEGLRQAGVIVGGKGKFRLKQRDELNSTWDPRTDDRITDWECVQHLVRAMTAKTGGGVTEAASLFEAMGPARAENSRSLAYRLFTVSERKGWNEEARAYNILVTSWGQIQANVAKLTAEDAIQSELAL